MFACSLSGGNAGGSGTWNVMAFEPVTCTAPDVSDEHVVVTFNTRSRSTSAPTPIPPRLPFDTWRGARWKHAPRYPIRSGGRSFSILVVPPPSMFKVRVIPCLDVKDGRVV